MLMWAYFDDANAVELGVHNVARRDGVLANERARHDQVARRLRA